MKDKILNLYFYKIEPKVIPEIYYKNQEKLKKAFSFSNSKKYKPILQSGGTVDLYGKRKRKGSLIFGTFTFIQLENIPPKQNVNTKNVATLDLEDDEGLGYKTSFMFDTETNILVIVNRRPGVTLGAIKKFAEVNFKLPSFTILPIIKPSRMTEFLTTDKYKKIRFKFADPLNVTPLISSNNPSISQIMAAADALNSGEVLYEVKAEKKEFLTSKIVRSIVNIFNKNSNDIELKELKVWGDTEEVKNDLFNFVTDRLTEKISVVTLRHGDFKVKDVYAKIEAKFEKNKSALRQLWKNHEE